MSGMTYALHLLYSLLVVYKVPKVYVYRYLPLTNADPLITKKVNSDSALFFSSYLIALLLLLGYFTVFLF
jgi:hypothetical protein